MTAAVALTGARLLRKPLRCLLSPAAAMGVAPLQRDILCCLQRNAAALTGSLQLVHRHALAHNQTSPFPADHGGAGQGAHGPAAHLCPAEEQPAAPLLSGEPFTASLGRLQLCTSPGQGRGGCHADCLCCMSDIVQHCVRQPCACSGPALVGAAGTAMPHECQPLRR